MKKKKVEQKNAALMFLQDYNISTQNVLTQKYLDECIPPEL